MTIYSEICPDIAVISVYYPRVVVFSHNRVRSGHFDCKVKSIQNAQSLHYDWLFALIFLCLPVLWFTGAVGEIDCVFGLEC